MNFDPSLTFVAKNEILSMNVILVTKINWTLSIYPGRIWWLAPDSPWSTASGWIPSHMTKTTWKSVNSLNYMRPEDPLLISTQYICRYFCQSEEIILQAVWIIMDEISYPFNRWVRVGLISKGVFGNFSAQRLSMLIIKVVRSWKHERGKVPMS